jgi:hypothetical protein
LILGFLIIFVGSAFAVVAFLYRALPVIAGTGGLVAVGLGLWVALRDRR